MVLTTLAFLESSFEGLREDTSALEVKRKMPVASTDKTKPMDGRRGGIPWSLYGITITHPDRVISDIGHVTKGEIAEYYAAIAP